MLTDQEIKQVRVKTSAAGIQVGQGKQEIQLHMSIHIVSKLVSEEFQPLTQQKIMLIL